MLTADASYVGTAAERLPRTSFPNAYPGATPQLHRTRSSTSSGNVIGGFGWRMSSRRHRTPVTTRCKLRFPATSGTAARHSGSFTWSKSIDDVSQVLGGTRSHRRRIDTLPQNPYETHSEKGPSNFDTTTGSGLSAAQDLHLDKVGFLEPLGKKVTGGWELLSISSINSGAPLPSTQASNNRSRLEWSGPARQIAVPHLSSARKDRPDYFGEGTSNARSFSFRFHPCCYERARMMASSEPLGRDFARTALLRLQSRYQRQPFAKRKSGAERRGFAVPVRVPSTCSTL